MVACLEAISVNDRRMLSNEILKQIKNFRFPVKKLIRNIFWEKRVWNFTHCQYIDLIDSIVIDHDKKKHPISAQAVETMSKYLSLKQLLLSK